MSACKKGDALRSAAAIDQADLARVAQRAARTERARDVAKVKPSLAHRDQSRATLREHLASCQVCS